ARLRLAVRAGSRRELRQLAPVVLLHFAVELGDRIHADTAQNVLDRALVFGSVVLKDTGPEEPGVGPRAEELRDPGRRFALPAGPDEEVEARLRSVHRADVGEAVSPKVHDLVHPEALAEVRHLEHYRAHVKGDDAAAVDHVLIRARDETLGGLDVVGEHA